jgi:hypothetical protein
MFIRHVVFLPAQLVVLPHAGAITTEVRCICDCVTVNVNVR